MNSSTLPNRGWKIRFHQTWFIFRVYVPMWWKQSTTHFGIIYTFYTTYKNGEWLGGLFLWHCFTHKFSWIYHDHPPADSQRIDLRACVHRRRNGCDHSLRCVGRPGGVPPPWVYPHSWMIFVLWKIPPRTWMIWEPILGTQMDKFSGECWNQYCYPLHSIIANQCIRNHA